jgi:hypothetical protein
LCDNNTFIVQSYQHVETDVRPGVTGDFTGLRNLATDKVIARQAPSEECGRDRRGGGQRASFNVHLLPHSYSVFAAEK